MRTTGLWAVKHKRSPYFWRCNPGGSIWISSMWGFIRRGFRYRLQKGVDVGQFRVRDDLPGVGWHLAAGLTAVFDHACKRDGTAGDSRPVDVALPYTSTT